MSIRLSAILFFSFFIPVAIWGQNITITGTVIDKTDNFPIPGASVVAKGTLLGTSTDFDGMFSLSIPDTLHVLTVSFIGMKSQEINIATQQEIFVALEPDVVGLEEITISVPYSKQSSDTYTGSVTVLRPKQLETGSPESIDKALQGNAPGIRATSPSGQPGSAAEIRLRGTGSLSAGSAPLYIIDGVPVNTGSMTSLSDNSNLLATLNPSDIESVSVLKDASATSLYGSRASNGVILITTKNGKKGETKYQFSTTQGISQITDPSFRMMNSQEYIAWKRHAMINSGYSESRILLELESDSVNTDWFDEVYRVAYSQSYEFSASGGSENTNFFISGKYNNDQGIVIGTDYEGITARANIEHKASDKLTFGTKSNIAVSTQNHTQSGDAKANPVVAAYLNKPTTPVYDEDGTYYFDNQTFNPVGISALNTNETKINRYFGNAYAEYEILHDLEFKSIFSADLINVKEFQFLHPETPDGEAINGYGAEANSKSIDMTSSNTLSYTKRFAKVHTATLLGGYEVQSNTTELSSASASNFANPNITSLSSASNKMDVSSDYEQSRIVSYFSNLQYSLLDKYYLSGSFRRDGSSKFSPNHKYANFWSLGFSWRVSSEPFFEKYENINNLKLRLSYGTSGNSDIRNYAYADLISYGENYEDLPGSAPSNLGNKDLTWEKNANADAGLDMRIYKRFTASIEVYRRRTYDLLLDVPISMTTGYSYQLQNVGEMINNGAELSLGAAVVDREHFSWNIDWNISHNKNKIIKLYNGEDIIQGSQIQREGESYNSFYLADWAGVDAQTGNPLWYDEKGNITKDYTKARKHIAGSPEPIFTTGLTNTVSYKNIDLSCLVFASYGNKTYNNLKRATVSDGAYIDQNQSTEAVSVWTEEGNIAENPAPVVNNPTNSNGSSDRYLEDGSYLRLKSVSIGYTIQNSKIKSQAKGSIRIYGQATNLWTWTAYSGIDPEQNLRGVEFFSYPNARTYSLGLSLLF